MTLLRFGLGILLLLTGLLHAQVTTDTVVVNAKLIRAQSLEAATQVWGTEALQRTAATSLADLMSSESNVFIKHYGAGSLATSSIRGGSAGHTVVLWNGLPIQSPMLGLLDLSLLPIQAAESISLQKGGNAALWGSGAIGGVLSLDNSADFSKRWQAQLLSELGSFGKWNQQLQVGWGSSRFQSRTKILHQQARNDFIYQIRDDIEPIRQSNAHFSQQNILQDVYWKINPKQQIALHFWQQFSSREIPPTTTQNRSEASQDDQATRLILDWQQATRTGIWQAKTAFFKEDIHYKNPLQSIDAPSYFMSYIGELNRQWTWRNQQFQLGATHTHTQASADGYRGTIPMENRTALFATYRWEKAKWRAQLSARQALVDGAFVPFLPNLDVRYQLSRQIQLQAKISRNYRLPTLNDRFWRPGGNPELKPESGWSQEGNLYTKTSFNKLKISSKSGLFYRIIDNWVLWSLQEGQAYWSANNIAQVRSWGAERLMEIEYPTGRVNWQFSSGHTYLRSENQIALERPRIEKGQQLYYTPKHQGFFKLRLRSKRWYAHYRHDYTGKSSGVNQDLDAYHLGQFRLQYTTKWRNLNSLFFVNAFNVWNKRYFIIERRPMAGRHFSVGFRLSVDSEYPPK